MWDKIGRFIARLLETTWKILIWVLILAGIYAIYTLGTVPGSLLDKLKSLPSTLISCNAPLPGVPQLRVNYYTVLVGTFRRPADAESLKSRLNASRINSAIISQSGAFFVVVGRYVSKNQAESALKNVQEKGYRNARIIVPQS